MEEKAIRVKDVDIPKLNAGDLLVKMKACGICGTDIEKVKGKGITAPILGHEVVGEVAEIGEGVSEFRKGDRVFVHHHVPCYSCHYCRHGAHTMCDRFRTSNLDPAGMAKFFRVPSWNLERGGVFRITPDIPYDKASLIEPLACCLRGLSRVKFSGGDDIAVFGLGSIGMIFVELLPLYGVGNIIGVDPVAFRRKMAQRLGATETVDPLDTNFGDRMLDLTEGRGVDMVVVATGNPQALMASIRVTRRGGSICLIGVPPKGAEVPIRGDDLFIREISIIPSYSATEVETHQAAALIAGGRFDPSKLITHRYPLEMAPEAFKKAMDPHDSLKVLVET